MKRSRSNDSFDLDIRPIKTSKDSVKQPKLAAHENMYIPPIMSSVIISGKSGSGKSTLLANLITEKRFYKGFFDKIFLFSPTANGDDIQRSLNIPKNHVFTDLEEGPELLAIILDSQQRKLDDGKKATEVEQYAIIFDDVIGDTKFMNTKDFARCFYQVRHANATTFICTQHFKKVPRICRLQANFIFYFQGSQSEVDTLVEEFAPPCYTSNEFRQIIHDATKDDFSFLTINMKQGWDKRFRSNLANIIPLPKLSGVECKEEHAANEQKGDGEVPNNRAGEGVDWGQRSGSTGDRDGDSQTQRSKWSSG